MATYNKFQDFVEQLGKGVHQLHAAGHTLKVYLSNAAPSASLDAVKADLAEFAGGTGYTTGGDDAQNDYTESAGTATLTCQDITWTAGAADWNQFQYAVLYNDTPAGPVDPLIAWWDYGSGVTPGNGETFTIDFQASTLTIT